MLYKIQIYDFDSMLLSSLNIYAYFVRHIKEWKKFNQKTGTVGRTEWSKEYLVWAHQPLKQVLQDHPQI